MSFIVVIWRGHGLRWQAGIKSSKGIGLATRWHAYLNGSCPQAQARIRAIKFRLKFLAAENAAEK
jgi:hypothetical protein